MVYDCAAAEIQASTLNHIGRCLCDQVSSSMTVRSSPAKDLNSFNSFVGGLGRGVPAWAIILYNPLKWPFIGLLRGMIRPNSSPCWWAAVPVRGLSGAGHSWDAVLGVEESC